MSKQADSVAGFRPGQRFQADGNGGGKGWIRYVGPVEMPQPQPESGAKQPKKKAKVRYFVGVEWDEEGRGKNDGSTGGNRYFQCEQGKGSFVHPQRVTAGVSLFAAIDAKYRSEFEAADQQRSLIAQNEPGGRTFEVPVVFAGHKETHEKLRDVAKLTHVVLNDAGVLGLSGEADEAGVPRAPDAADVARLRELLPSCAELDLGNNLMSSWLDVAAVTEALDLVELRLSSNALGDDLPVQRIAESGSMARIERLFVNAVPNAWARVRELDAAGALPALRELHVCVNGMETLGGGGDDEDANAPIGGFAQLEFLNLTENRIADWAQIERLRALPSLRRLMLNGNPVTEIRLPKPGDGGVERPFAALEWLSVRDCRLASWASIDRLNEFPALREIGMLRNPITDGMSERDMRVQCVARVRGLRVMNHSEVTRRERGDAEKLYLKRVAQDALNRKMEEASAEEHPRYRELIEQYGYPAGVKAETKAQPALKGRLVTVRVYDGTDEDPDACKTKKVPKTMTVGALKALVMRLYKVPAPRQALTLVRPDGERVALDDTIKQLTYYDMEGEASIVMERL